MTDLHTKCFGYVQLLCYYHELWTGGSKEEMVDRIQSHLNRDRNPKSISNLNCLSKTQLNALCKIERLPIFDTKRKMIKALSEEDANFFSENGFLITCVRKNVKDFGTIFSSCIIPMLKQMIKNERVHKMERLASMLLKKHFVCQSINTWKIISAVEIMFEDFLDYYADKIDWSAVCRIQELNHSFLKRFEDRVNWQIVSNCQSLSNATIIEFAPRLNWLAVSRKQRLSISVIDMFSDRVHWPSICRYQKLNRTLINKYKDRVRWPDICRHQKLSEHFMKKNADILDWVIITQHQHLSEGFIRRNQDLICWKYIFETHYKYSDDFIMEFRDRDVKNLALYRLRFLDS